MSDNTIENIKKSLDEMRPFLQRDGGDIEFIKYEDNVVVVNMKGACSSCASIETTLKAGVEAILIETVPGVIEVRQATEEELWEGF